MIQDIIRVLPPSKCRPEVPRDLDQIVVRCLAKEPHERFQDVESLGQALAACEAAGRWTQERAAQWWQTIDLSGIPSDAAAELSPTAIITRDGGPEVDAST